MIRDSRVTRPARVSPLTTGTVTDVLCNHHGDRLIDGRSGTDRDYRLAHYILDKEVPDPVVLVLIVNNLAEVPHCDRHVCLGDNADNPVLIGNDKPEDIIVDHPPSQMNHPFFGVNGAGIFHYLLKGAIAGGIP